MPQPHIVSVGPVRRLIPSKEPTMIYLCRGWLTVSTHSRWWADILIKSNGFVEIEADDYNAISAIADASHS